MDHYVKKTFYKTASLMANSCKAVAILGGGSRETSQEAWEYGRNLGLAFQVGQNSFEYRPNLYRARLWGECVGI